MHVEKKRLKKISRWAAYLLGGLVVLFVMEVLGDPKQSAVSPWINLEGVGLFKRGDSRFTNLFRRGDGGYAILRIPAIAVTSKGVVLAICEGRESGSDHGNVDLVMRRSLDGGKTWSELKLLYEEGGDKKVTIGNPCVVTDSESGAVFLAVCRNNQDVFIICSGDDGLTWEKPEDLTARIKDTSWGWIATGPGHGIQLMRGPHKGRLVIPCDCEVRGIEGEIAESGHSFVIFSDDHGTSWTRGGVTSKGMNECEVVERSDGSLLLSMRNYLGKERRAFAVSRDGGVSWSSPVLHPQVYCSVCQASILRYSFEPSNVMLYTGPALGRRLMTMRVSFDEGQTWPIAKLLYGRQTSYSDLVRLSSGEIGLLMENDDHTVISFVCFSLSEIVPFEFHP